MDMKMYRGPDFPLCEKIRALINNEKQKIDELRRELAAIKGGKLYIKRKKGSTYFVEYISGKEKGISRDGNRVYRLARKQYIESLLI